MTNKELIRKLHYIADSPAKDHGGFDETAIEAAKGAIERIANLEELVRASCAIAERKGEGTAWNRYLTSARNLGLNGVTARTYRVLAGDPVDP